MSVASCGCLAVVTELPTGIHWRREPSHVTGVKGETVWLNCSALSSHGYGHLTVSWLKDDESIANSTRRYGTAADNALQLTSLVRRDEGDYRCLVSNDAGFIVSRVASVKVICTYLACIMTRIRHT